MAYQVPPRLAQGSTVSHTNMQKYSDALNAIHDKTKDAAINLAYPIRYEYMSAYREWTANASAQSFFTMVHQNRYLVYEGDGRLESLDGVNSTSLSYSGSGGNIYDLDSVGWLVYGVLYRVKTCRACAEYDIARDA